MRSLLAPTFTRKYALKLGALVVAYAVVAPLPWVAPAQFDAVMNATAGAGIRHVQAWPGWRDWWRGPSTNRPPVPTRRVRGHTYA